MPRCFWALWFLLIVQLLGLVSLHCLYVTSFLLAEQYNLLLPVYRKLMSVYGVYMVSYIDRQQTLQLMTYCLQ
ncbi:hypothetical protein BDV09DRAFT_157768 [Aspergillus tetrazonus]